MNSWRVMRQFLSRPMRYPQLMQCCWVNKQNNISLKCFRFFSNPETGETLRGFVSYNLYATSPKSHLCSASSFSAPTAVAKPQGIVDWGGEETEPASGWPTERFLTPEPDEDFVDPVDEYKMPWEEDMSLQDMPLLEGVNSKAGNALSYSRLACPGSSLRTRALSCWNYGISSQRS